MAIHPRDHDECPRCRNEDPTAYEKAEEVPRLGRTYICQECDLQLYVYEATDAEDQDHRLRWRRVTRLLQRNLVFYDLVGEWPDSVLLEKFEVGLSRRQAMDYHATVHEGLTQVEWAARLGIKQGSVSRNVTGAAEKLRPFPDLQ